MSVIHLNQIKASLKSTFDGLIDLEDVNESNGDLLENVFISRSLAAFSIMCLSDIDAGQASEAITDGAQDNGIDAIHYDESEKIVYLVQSKWSKDGKGTISKAGAQKFINGFRDLINARFDRFNDKVRQKKDQLTSALNDAKTHFVTVISYTGNQDLPDDIRVQFDDMLGELNDPTQVVTLRVLNQANLYSSVVHGMKAEPINIDLALREWGKTQEPYEAYYGQVAASDVAEWYDQHYPRLFSPNIRTFLGDTSVNESIRETLSSEPEKFWYYNNGITALSEKIEKKPIGGSTRESGLFECKNFEIVNGAQTVGAIFDEYSKNSDKLEKALVPVRIISLEQTPKDFDKSVTKYNNTQNKIERRDFVSLDSQQERLKTELKIEDIEYAYKSGQSVGGTENGFDLEEATIALACSQSDVRYCVYAKREIGMLWEDIEGAPYKVLFNPTLNGIHLWKLVQALRCIEDTLQLIEERSKGRAELLAVHGKRFIEHLVYQKVGEKN